MSGSYDIPVDESKPIPQIAPQISFGNPIDWARTFLLIRNSTHGENKRHINAGKSTKLGMNVVFNNEIRFEFASVILISPDTRRREWFEA